MKKPKTARGVASRKERPNREEARRGRVISRARGRGFASRGGYKPKERGFRGRGRGRGN